jgi:hypothetical protein
MKVLRASVNINKLKEGHSLLRNIMKVMGASVNINKLKEGSEGNLGSLTLPP